MTAPVVWQPVVGQPGRHGHHVMSPVVWGYSNATGEPALKLLSQPRFSFHNNNMIALN